jgi:TonB family protein
MPDGSQRCSRTKMVLPLRVWVNGQDGETQPTQLAHTLDISHIGCRLGGLRTELSPGQTIALQRGQHKANFRVIWSKHLGPDENQAGIEALEYGKNIWAVELPPSPFVPTPLAPGVAQVSTFPQPAPLKLIPLATHSYMRGLSFALLLLGLALGSYGYYKTFYQSGRVAIHAQLPVPPSAADLARLTPKPHPAPALLTTALVPSASRVQVAETPIGHVVYPVAPDDSIRGKVRLQIIVAANGAVKQIRALSGKQILAEAAAQAVRFWHYSSFPAVEQLTERETTVTVSFVGADAVSLEFPSSNTQIHAN